VKDRKGKREGAKTSTWQGGKRKKQWKKEKSSSTRYPPCQNIARGKTARKKPVEVRIGPGKQVKSSPTLHSKLKRMTICYQKALGVKAPW